MGSKQDEPFHRNESKEEREARLEEMFMVPGEVVSKRQRWVTKEEAARHKDEFVSMSWSDIFPKKPMDRLRWLYKAFQAAKRGQVKPAPLFDIISHRKFIEGLQGSIATDVLNLIRGNLSIFSARQRKQLTSESFELFRKFAPFSILDSDEDEADAPPLPPPPEVIVQVKMRDRKRKHVEEELRRRQEREREEEEAEGRRSDEELASKRQRILAKGVERRVDPADGEAYTLQDFIKEYGGSVDSVPVEWERARNTSFVFKE